MPLYTVTTQGGSLSNDAKVELAAKLTALHCEMSGVPKSWVHIIFHDYPTGSGFTAGEPVFAATVALALLIRTGRLSEYKRESLNLETAADAEPIEIIEMRPTAPHSLNLAETLYGSMAYMQIWSSNCRF